MTHRQIVQQILDSDRRMLSIKKKHLEECAQISSAKLRSYLERCAIDKINHIETSIAKSEAYLARIHPEEDVHNS